MVVKAGLVGIDQRVVENQARRFALALRQQRGERQADQHGELLARADAQAVERLLEHHPGAVGQAQVLGVDDRSAPGNTRCSKGRSR